MAYSYSKKQLDEIRPLLKKLELLQEETFHVPGRMKPSEFAIKIRSALATAALYPNDYPALAKAQRFFRIVTRQGQPYVWAVIVDKDRMKRVVAGGPNIQGLASAGPLPVKLMGKQSALSIVEYYTHLQKLQPTNNQLGFPQADLSKEDREKLFLWASRRQPPWIMMVADKSVTLARKSRDNEDVAWTPEDEE